MSEDNSYRQMEVDKTLKDHENRITANERFRLRAEGALTLLGFAVGSGFALTLVLWSLGLV